MRNLRLGVNEVRTYEVYAHHDEGIAVEVKTEYAWWSMCVTFDTRYYSSLTPTYPFTEALKFLSHGKVNIERITLR